MQTTQQALQQLKGKRFILCVKCRKSADFQDFKSREISIKGIEEIGLECPHCAEWYHSYFLDNDLKDNRPKPRADRRVRREYKKRFQAFQKKTRKRLGLRKVNGRWLNSSQ